MRFKRGTKVEVLSYCEAPYGQWRCAEIISGNGHTYSVQYNCSSLTNEAMVEKVPKKSIRPSPPLVKCADSWSADDVVEVNHAGCWKVAVVSKFISEDIYLVRLLGSCKELRVHKFNIRARQCWQDNQWIMMRKGNSRVGKSGKNLSFNSYKMKPEVPQARNDCFPIVDGSGLRESYLVSSTSLKRVSPYCSSFIDTYPRKMRAVMNEEVLEKVDAGSYPSEHMGEKCMLASFNNGTNQYNEMAMVNPNNGTSHCLERISDSNDSCSDICSVGSCSVISSGPNKFSSDMLAGLCQDADSLCSDAESLDVGGEEEKCSLYPKEDIAARIHRLELHAYCSTLKAMFASGPLTWEQEALLTNLRISLHISNDEHLLEIRNLVSSGQRF
ncbi:uncharacterized protein LOC129294464 [Prosopis cineraria]|uniref:uncharacterized protein LOC129294464 n=1 Tax=Prosopis cineraria TaxID=364024 RepID=UPI0024100B0D|nr:uncharacterized protein LOC129294464 [Prosopis cineraria]